MGHWNYRVIKCDTDENIVYRIHEVYYNDNGEIEGFIEDPVHASGESFEELLSDLDMMIKDAKNLPTLSLKELNRQFKETESKRCQAK